MEQVQEKESEQYVLDSKGQSLFISNGVGKSSAASPLPSERRGIVGSQNLEKYLATQTPEKATEASQIRHSSEADELPDKFRIMLEFFYCMTCSLRILGLCKKSPTFRNICSQVEILTGRKFEYKHLAQIKYILPEAIQIGKILVHDAETMCMMPEISISLLFDVVEGHHEESVFVALSHLFASRLKNFLGTHPEACEIPEAILPKPFNQMGITNKENQWHVDISTSTDAAQVRSSHFCPSFGRCFSQKADGTETEKTRLIAWPLPCSSNTDDEVTDQEIDNPRTSPDRISSINKTFVQEAGPQLYDTSSTREITPMKPVTDCATLMIETPAQSTPKRSLPTCEDKHQTMINQICTACNGTAKRSLDFTKLDDEESSLNLTMYEMGPSTTLPNTSTRMEIKAKSVKDEFTALTLCKDETSNFFSGKGNESFQGCLAPQPPISVCLFDLVLTIHCIFQSVNCRSITKEELVHKIIMNNCNIDDKRDIEEQIEHLEKLVPDWISKKFTPSGDLLYNIRMVSDLNSVRERVINI